MATSPVRGGVFVGAAVGTVALSGLADPQEQHLVFVVALLVKLRSC